MPCNHLAQLSLLTVLVLFIQTSVALAQPRDLRFDHLSTEQGLSQDIVTAIVQDREGFMWFATEDGLNRYDGYSIKVYKSNPRDTFSIAFNFHLALFVDNSGALWAVGHAALSRYDPVYDRFENVAIDGGIASACPDPRGGVWVGTARGLKYIDKHMNMSNHAALDFKGESNLETVSVYALHYGRSGHLWMGTSEGLFRLDPPARRVDRIPISNARLGALSQVKAMTEDVNGALWLAIVDGGLRKLDLEANQVTTLLPGSAPGSLSDPRVLTLLEDRHGNIWAGTFSGLDRYVPSTNSFIHYENDPYDRQSLIQGRVYSIYQDKDATLWIGTYRGGVSWANPLNQRFERHIHSPNRPSFQGSNVYALFEDRESNLWIGSDSSGIYKLSRKENRFTRYARQSNGGSVLAICCDRKGRIWFSTFGSGIACFDPVRNSVTRYRHRARDNTTLASNNVRSLFVDKAGSLWVGYESSGLSRFNEQSGTFVHFNVEPRREHVGVWLIFETRSGDMLIGTMYGTAGLYKFDRPSGSFAPIGTPGIDGSIEGSVRAAYEDSSGIIWLGAWQGGLFRYDPFTSTVERFTELDGLANNYVKGMLADDRGNLWISTENGMSRFTMKERVFRNFSTREGLQSNFFWSGSSVKGADGWMYFGGTNGFNAFHPDSIRDNPNAPSVVITRFTALNKPLIPSISSSGMKIVELSYEQDFFSIEFVALNFTAPEKNQYAYMMDGFDDTWVQAGTRRFASYTHLDPGTYTFKVKGSNNDGVWNDKGTHLLITIAPPFWQRWWFRGFFLVTIIGALYGLYRNRVRRLLEMERLRVRIAADLHDDVGSELGHIALASQLLARKVSLPEKEQRQLTSISTSALHASDMMREVVWLLNPKNDSLSNIILKMKGLADEQLDGVTVMFATPQGELPDAVDLQIKRNIYLMYKEVLHNIVKHAQARSVSIQIQYHPRTLTLTVTDDGIGFEPAAVHGNGLQNLRTRTAQMGGTLSITSMPHKGTTITVSVAI